jgi:hypothetical protein
MHPSDRTQGNFSGTATSGGLAGDAVELLAPLIGIRGQYAGRVLELVEVLADGPRVALLDISSAPHIQTNQYGDPLTRQPRILTLAVVSEVEPDVHPVLRALLPVTIVAELRQLIHGRQGIAP